MYRRRLLLLAPVILVLVLAGSCTSGGEDLVAREVVSVIPWDPPQSWTYAMIDNGDNIGSGAFSVEKDGRDLVFKQKFDFPDRKISDDIVARVSAAALFPVSVERTLDGNKGIRHCTGAYEANDVSVHDESDEGQRDDVLNYPAPSYDSWVDIFLWATIDFSEGYETPYVDMLVCKLAKPDLLGARLKVIQREQVQVPAGTFDAWHLEIKAGGDTQDAWYTADEKRTLVRYDNGQIVFELESAP